MCANNDVIVAAWVCASEPSGTAHIGSKLDDYEGPRSYEPYLTVSRLSDGQFLRSFALSRESRWIRLSFLADNQHVAVLRYTIYKTSVEVYDLRGGMLYGSIATSVPRAPMHMVCSAFGEFVVSFRDGIVVLDAKGEVVRFMATDFCASSLSISGTDIICRDSNSRFTFFR